MTYSERGIVFHCLGGQLLGVVSTPSACGDTGVVIIVGGPQYRVGSHRQFVLMARHLASAGYPVIRFDTRGMGDSSGNFPGFEHIGPDIVGAVQAFRREVPQIRRIVLWGLCDAASAAMINAASIDDVAGLVLLNPWARNAETLASAEIKHYYHRRLLDPAFWRKLASGQVSIATSLREFFCKVAHQFFRKTRPGVHVAETGDFRERMTQGLAGFSGQVLWILSGRDLVAAEFIEFAARHPALADLWRRPGMERLDLPEADHTFSSRIHRRDAEAATLRWLENLRQGEQS